MENRLSSENEAPRRGRPPKVEGNTSKETKESKYLPFISKDELPAPILDNKGKFKGIASYRYKVTTISTPLGNKYKLIRIFKKPSGVCHELVKVLAPFKKTKIGASDKAFLKELKEYGVPGIY